MKHTAQHMSCTVGSQFCFKVSGSLHGYAKSNHFTFMADYVGKDHIFFSDVTGLETAKQLDVMFQQKNWRKILIVGQNLNHWLKHQKLTVGMARPRQQASAELVSHLLEVAYRRVISPTLKQLKSGVSGVTNYGEFGPACVFHIANHAMLNCHSQLC